MKIVMDCLLIFLSGFVFWQFTVIYKEGFWSCHLDFPLLFPVSIFAIGIAILGAAYAFLRTKIPFRSQMIGILISAVGIAVFFVDFIPAWFRGGNVYGHEPVEFVLLAELALLGGITVFGLINLGVDFAEKRKK